MEEFLDCERDVAALRALAAINHNPAARCEIPTWRRIRIGETRESRSLSEQ
jgi:hypothetical protein